MMTKKWWKEGVAYQIYVRSFKDSNGDGIGDLRGIKEKIPYLKELGIDIVYLNPINTSPNDDNGYDISDFRDIMTEFGGLEAFDELLEAIHEAGLKLILDLVINHSSDEHPWFREACKSKDNPYHDYYLWEEGRNGKEPNNWGSFFGGSAWEYVESVDQYYLHLFSKKQPDFNWRNENLRKEMIDVLKFWARKGVDGFRLDAINHIEKDHSYPDGKVREGQIYGDFIKYVQNLPEVHGYLKEIREEVLSVNKDLVLIGETGGISYDSAFVYTGVDRGELDMVFHFDMHSVGKGDKDWERQSINLKDEIKDKFTGWQSRPDSDGWCPIFYSNHDTTRTVSRLGDDDDSWKRSAKMLAMMQLTCKGTPFIYNGDEIGMTNAYQYQLEDYDDVAVMTKYKDFVESGLISHEQYLKGLHLTSRDNARTPMQWSGSQWSGFSTSMPWLKLNDNYHEVNVEEQENDEESILNFYKILLRLRKENPTFVYGEFSEVLSDHEQVYGYVRRDEENYFLVLINFFGENTEVDFSNDELSLEGKLVLSNTNSELQLQQKFSLSPYESAIFKLSMK